MEAVLLFSFKVKFSPEGVSSRCSFVAGTGAARDAGRRKERIKAGPVLVAKSVAFPSNKLKSCGIILVESRNL